MIINQKTLPSIIITVYDDSIVIIGAIEKSTLNKLISVLQKHAPPSIHSPSARAAKARNDQRMKDIEGIG